MWGSSALPLLLLADVPASWVTQANYTAWVLSELGAQTIPYAMSDQS